jgi:hypothetical protein
MTRIDANSITRNPCQKLLYSVLINFVALFAMMFAACPLLFMFRLDAFSIRASVLVVIDLARIFV